jgi:hypothetical protein
MLPWLLTIPVVLLDEADVFLEQRSFANLERNALVSGELHNGGMYPLLSTSLTVCSLSPCDRVLRR